MKKFFGNQEVSKEYFGNYLVYQKQSGLNNIQVEAYLEAEGYYKLNDGTAVDITTLPTKQVEGWTHYYTTLNNVDKLEVMYTGRDVSYVEIYDANDNFVREVDSTVEIYTNVTSYLHDGYKVYVLSSD